MLTLILLLLLSSSPNLPPSMQETISIFLVVAKSAIALKWKDPKPPTLKLWHKTLGSSYIMAKISDDLTQDMDWQNSTNFSAVWFSILEYFTQMEAPAIPRSMHMI